MDPRPTNYLRQNIFFLIPGDDTSFFFFFLFLSVSVFCYFTLLLVFTNIILLLVVLLYFFHENYFYFSCSGMFRNVLCSWFYRRPIRTHVNESIRSDCYVLTQCSKIVYLSESLLIKIWYTGICIF